MSYRGRFMSTGGRGVLLSGGQGLSQPVSHLGSLLSLPTGMSLC